MLNPFNRKKKKKSPPETNDSITKPMDDLTAFYASGDSSDLPHSSSPLSHDSQGFHGFGGGEFGGGGASGSYDSSSSDSGSDSGGDSGGGDGGGGGD